MNLIPESNGLKRINMKEKIHPVQWVKRFAIVIVGIFAIGFIFQLVSNFVGKEKVQSRLNYAKIDGKKQEYRTRGAGDFTIVFDGAIGANLYEWESIAKEVEKELDVKTFVYNRNGYGFSDIGEIKTPKEKAEELKILLRKAGVTGSVILVGEEYGSLVMTNFANLYPESVKGMVLVQPFNEENIKSEAFRKEIKWKYYRSKIEKVGASFGLTTLLEKFGLAIKVNDFEENLPKGADEEFAVHKTKKNYRQAISNELENIYNYEDNSQIDGLMKNKPLYIISNRDDEELSKLGTAELTSVYKTDSDSKIISITDSESVITGINYVVKEAKRIERRTEK
ncbi:alpha/beta fold hydrolase [Clostridium paraputrificum]|uniref:alpha/beta fold hydrolase n=1 Tax=Clostridium paraputrificum TaxID=29363 RepID=UPI003D3471D3